MCRRKKMVPRANLAQFSWILPRWRTTRGVLGAERGLGILAASWGLGATVDCNLQQSTICSAGDDVLFIPVSVVPLCTASCFRDNDLLRLAYNDV